MDEVNNIEEAMVWFLKNHSGSVMCVKKDGTRLECETFIDAKGFFNEE